MSAHVKKAGRVGTKVVAAFLFLVLVMFNVEVGMYDGEGSGILGITVNTFLSDLMASGWCCSAYSPCGECHAGGACNECTCSGGSGGVHCSCDGKQGGLDCDQLMEN